MNKNRKLKQLKKKKPKMMKTFSKEMEVERDID